MAHTEHVRGVTGRRNTVAARILNKVCVSPIIMKPPAAVILILPGDPFASSFWHGAVFICWLYPFCGSSWQRQDNYLSFGYVDGARGFQIC
jgi:hypothetical protein